jgi:hypothetical protein
VTHFTLPWAWRGSVSGGNELLQGQHSLLPSSSSTQEAILLYDGPGASQGVPASWPMVITWHLCLLRQFFTEYSSDCPSVINPLTPGFQKNLLGQMDGYLVHGEEYKAVRDAMGKAVLECKTPGIGNALMVGRAWGCLVPGNLLVACIFPCLCQMTQGLSGPESCHIHRSHAQGLCVLAQGWKFHPLRPC